MGCRLERLIRALPAALAGPWLIPLALCAVCLGARLGLQDNADAGAIPTILAWLAAGAAVLAVLLYFSARSSRRKESGKRRTR